MEVVASAPGKVLITGGYLILERPNAGIVLSTNARFYAIVGPLYEEIKPESWAWAWADVKLTSPQLAREATYKLSLKDLTLQCVSSRESVNPFVEQAVQYAIAAAQTLHTDKDSKNTLRNILLQGIDITILGCNEFYSYRSQIEAHGLPLTSETLSKLPPFSSITFNPTGPTDKSRGNSSKPEVAKTGLGSSAAMTTSVVAALLQYLKVIDLQLSSKFTVEDSTPYSGLDLVHVIAQCAHCIAQGKVGSGFDVSSAVFGSQRYVRFSSSVLSPTQIYGSRQVQNAVNEVLKENWDHERFQFSLPPLMELVLGEPGVGGSSTPSMVGAVKQWQKVAPEKSHETWKLLAKANSLVEDQFKALSRLAEEEMEVYKDTVIRCSLLNYSQWPKQTTGEHQTAVVKSLLGVRDAFLQIRSCMKLMGEAAGVPIEPEPQTRLLDSTMEIDGVVLAGVPGAGGFDAVFAITLCDAKQKVIQTWTSMGVLPLLVREDPRGVSLETGDPRTPDFSPAISSIRIK